MNYFVHHQHQECDPSSQNQESYDQFTNNHYSYSYSYPNPQFSSSNHPYPYQNPIVQPSQHEEQEPNPPGVPPPPPPPEMCQNSYYQYHVHGGAAAVPIAGPQPGAVPVDTSVQAVVHQPNVQPLYGGVGIMDGIAPRGHPQTHLGPNLNVSSCSFHVNGRGRGHALPMNAATPFYDQTVTAYGGIHIQGGSYQHPSQSFGETRHVPRSKVSGHRGRGRGCVQQKNAVVAPAQDLKLGASSFGQTLVPLQPASVPLPPKAVSCELCKVECNTLEILQQHVNGKKHKKKLKVFEELQNLNRKVIGGQAEQKPTTELKSEVVSQPDRVEVSENQQLQQEVLPSQEINDESRVEGSENQQVQHEVLPSQEINESEVAGEKRKVEEVAPPEESAKKTRVAPSECTRPVLKHKLRGGKSGRKMRPCGRSKSLVQLPKPKEVAPPLVCELCNVKCESLVVFQSHLAGKKHKSKAKRFLSQETFGPELLQLQRPPMPAVDQSNATAPTPISFQFYDQGFGAYPAACAQNVRSGEVEAMSQPESHATNSGAAFAGGTWNEARSETGARAAEDMVGIAGGYEHGVTCRTTMDGGASSERNVASIKQPS